MAQERKPDRRRASCRDRWRHLSRGLQCSRCTHSLLLGQSRVFLRLFVLERASAVFLSAVFHSAVTRVTHPLIFSPRMIHLHCDEKSWEPHVDGRFQLGMSLKEVRPGHGTSLRAGPHPGAVDVSGLFHQTVTNCRGRESVCGLWPLPFHFLSSCAGIASLAPSDRATPAHPPPSKVIYLERWRGGPRVAATFNFDISLSP